MAKKNVKDKAPKTSTLVDQSIHNPNKSNENNTLADISKKLDTIVNKLSAMQDSIDAL